MTRIYLGNLPPQATDTELREMLQRDGRTVTLVNIKRNGTTGKPRGFAFVDMGSQEEAQAAIQALNGAELGGRTIKVNFAKELEVRKSLDWASSPARMRGGRGPRR